MRRDPMRCDEFERLLDRGTVESLGSEEESRMLSHAVDCTACAERRQALVEALDACRNMGAEAEVPQAAAAAWRRAIRAEAAAALRRRGFAANRWQPWVGLAAGILILIGSVGLMRDGRLGFPNLSPAQEDAGVPAEKADEQKLGRAAALVQDADTEAEADALPDLNALPPMQAASSMDAAGEALHGAPPEAPKAAVSTSEPSVTSAPGGSDRAHADLDEILMSESQSEGAQGLSAAAPGDKLFFAPAAANEEPEALSAALLELDDRAGHGLEAEPHASPPAEFACEPRAWLPDAGMLAALCLPLALIVWIIRLLV